MEENTTNNEISQDLSSTKTDISKQIKENIRLQNENLRINSELLESQKKANDESKQNRELLDKKLKIVQERNTALKKANELEKSKQEFINSKIVVLSNIEILVDETFQAVTDIDEKLQNMRTELTTKLNNMNATRLSVEAQTQQILLTVLEVLRQLPLFLNSKDSTKIEENYNRLLGILDKISSKNVTVQNISADRDISLNQ